MRTRSANNWTNLVSLFCFFGTAIIGLTLDLTTKHWADLHLRDQPGLTVISGLLRLEWTPNHGAALGFLQGYRWFFLAVSVAAVAFLCSLFASSVPRKYGYQIILGVLMAGVLGNMYDRVRLGYVRDLIHALPGQRWPAAVAEYLPRWWGTPELFPWIFNVADSLLCVGVSLMMLHILFTTPSSSSPAAPPPTESAHPSSAASDVT